MSNSCFGKTVFLLRRLTRAHIPLHVVTHCCYIRACSEEKCCNVRVSSVPVTTVLGGSVIKHQNIKYFVLFVNPTNICKGKIPFSMLNAHHIIIINASLCRT